jgi:hypothetical protein
MSSQSTLPFDEARTLQPELAVALIREGMLPECRTSIRVYFDTLRIILCLSSMRSSQGRRLLIRTAIAEYRHELTECVPLTLLGIFRYS